MSMMWISIFKRITLPAFVIVLTMYLTVPKTIAAAEGQSITGSSVVCCLTTGSMTTTNDCGMSALYGCTGNKIWCQGDSNFKYCDPAVSESTCSGAPDSACVYQDNDQCKPF
jgi:hypothetical protein